MTLARAISMPPTNVMADPTHQHILIVDDHAINRKLLLRALLEAEGYSLFEAADGVEALEILGRQPVSAVIADILMPRMGRSVHETAAGRKSQISQAHAYSHR